jgi:hypothetical protein
LKRGFWERGEWGKLERAELARGNDKFVAVGNAGKMAYSSDGVTWTAVTNSPFGTDDIEAIAWGNGKFVAGSWRGQMAYSSDGITWTAVADDVIKFYYPTKATDPEFEMDGIYSAMILAIAYGNGKFVVSTWSGKTAVSSDGVTWTVLTENIFGEGYINNTISAIIWGSDKFVAVSAGSKIAYWNGNL